MSEPIIPANDPAGARGTLLTRVYVRVRAALAELAREAGAPKGLGDEDQAAGRLLRVSERETGGLRIDVASDGLDLTGKAALETAVRSALGAERGELTVYFGKRPVAAAPASGPAPLKEKKGAFGVSLARQAILGVGRVVVVASGKGGVGKSTVSANLAVALARRGVKVGLLDADIYGPSAPLMMGLSTARPSARGDKLVPLEAHGVKVMSFGFLTDVQEPAIWRGPLIAKAFRQLAFDVAWGDLDYLVIDLPPGTGDVQLALVENVEIHTAVVVTTPQDMALIDAHKALSMFERLAVPVAGIVENMAHFHCSQCGHAEAIFGEGGADRMAAARRLEVLARIPLAGAVRSRGDEGRPVALDDAAPGAAAFAELATRIQGAGRQPGDD